MVATSKEGRPRPAIKPIRTTGPGHGSQAVYSRMAFKSPAWVAAPMSPRNRPCPMHPDSDDGRMREHDKAAVGLLEPRSRRNSPSIEITPADSFMNPFSKSPLPTPLRYAQQMPLSAPLIPPSASGRLTIAEESRNILMNESGTTEHGSPSQSIGRRGSVPSEAMRLRLMQNQLHRDALRRRGFIGSRGIRMPDLLVMPAELRRLSTLSVSNDDGVLPSPFPVEGRLTTRAIIHSPTRNPIVLTRTFNLEELRATIPARVPVSSVPSTRRTSIANSRPSPLFSSRILSPKIPNTPRIRRHSSTSLTPLGSFGHPHELEKRALRHRLNAVPIYLEYARMYLPVLAAVILSRIVRPEDILELPLPQPTAWEDTVAYIYTGRMELTEPIRQNILYLGGKA